MTQIPIQKTSEKGQPNGYAALDGSGNVLDGAGDVVGGGGFTIGAEVDRGDIATALTAAIEDFDNITPLDPTKATMVVIEFRGDGSDIFGVEIDSASGDAWVSGVCAAAATTVATIPIRTCGLSLIVPAGETYTAGAGTPGAQGHVTVLHVIERTLG